MSAWYHLVFIWDTTQSTQADRQKFYVNGTQQDVGQTRNNWSLNENVHWNEAISHNAGYSIGYNAFGHTEGNSYGCYASLAETIGIDGQDVSISDLGESKLTPNFIGSGVLFAFGEGRGRTKPRWIAYVRIGIFGAAKTNFSLLHKGSGNLFSFSSGEDSRSYAYSGSGALCAFSGAAESVGSDYPVTTALLPLTGTARVNFTPNWNGEGVATLTGASVERQTDSWQGSGTLFNFETADESITYHYSSTSNAIFGYRNYGSVASIPIESITLQSIANETIDMTERYDYLMQAERLLISEMPIIPIYTYVRQYQLSSDVKGWHPNLLDTHHPKFIYLER